MSTINFTTQHVSHPNDFKNLDTENIRNRFLVDNLFVPNQINMVYSMYDRFIIGGVIPQNTSLCLDTIEPLKTAFFLQRRELGIVNIGGNAKINVDNNVFELGFKDALYIGQGAENVTFMSVNPNNPAKLYFNSATAHKSYPTVKVNFSNAEKLEAGSLPESNKRTVNKLIVNSIVETCQLQMGLTEFADGSVWNTMPPHTHSRRMEAYLYFDVPQNHAVCHFMGQPQQTRHIWVHNLQAVISPYWSIHSGVGTSKYSFIWGMAGENLDYTDMEVVNATQLL